MKSKILKVNRSTNILYITLLLLAMCSVCQAQEILYEMNFNDFNAYTEIEDSIYEFPSGWVQYDADGNTLHNTVDRYFPSPNVGFSLIDGRMLNKSDLNGGVAVAASYFVDTTLVTDDWLCSPGIEVPSSGLVLTWEGKSQQVEFKESYEVFITTKGNDLNTLTSLTIEDRVKNIVDEDINWTKHGVNLNDYVGETIYIAFHLYSENKFFFLLDNIQIIDPGNSVDIVLNTPSLDLPIKYGMMPLSHVEPIGPFIAPINNISGLDVGDITFTVTIEEVLGGLDTLLDLEITSVDDLIFEPVWEKSVTFAGPYERFSLANLEMEEFFTPDHKGLYAMKYEVEHEDDVDATNNFSEKYYFEITDDNLARHAFYHTYLDPPLLSDFEAFYSTPDDEENNDLTPVEEYGIVVELDKSSVLDSVSLLLNAPTGTISVNVYNYNDVAGIGLEPIATNTIDFGPSGNTFSFYILPMLEPVNLAPGKYFISANDPDDGSLTMVFCNYYDSPKSAFINLYNSSNWTELSEAVPVIELVMGEATNPATNITIDTSLDEATFTGTAQGDGVVESYIWDFGNGDTQEGAFVTYNYNVPGTYEICLSADTGEQVLEECTQLTIGSACDFNGNVVATNTEATATTSGGQGPFTFTWLDATGNEILTTEQDIITGLNPDTDYILVISDGNGCSYELPFTTLLENVGIGEIELLRDFSVFPTPAQAFVQLKVNLSEVAKISYEIVDITGKQIISVDLGNNDQINEIINTESLQNGYYLLILDINGKQTAKKIIIQ